MQSVEHQDEDLIVNACGHREPDKGYDGKKNSFSRTGRSIEIIT